MLNRHIALVRDMAAIDFAELAAAAGALRKQVIRDFGPIWGVAAVVTAYASLEHIPLDGGPISVRTISPVPKPSAITRTTWGSRAPWSGNPGAAFVSRASDQRRIDSSR